jgi:NIMA (never in mitosis gene a)-related kinase
LDSFLEGNELVIALEWAAAGDLKRQIRKAQEKATYFEERVCWKYFSQIADALRWESSVTGRGGRETTEEV